MTDAVGNRTIRSQWEETILFYGECLFLEYLASDGRTFCFRYDTFDRLVKKTANVFLSQGITQGELVALQFHNSPEYLLSFLGLAQIGAVAVPLIEHYSPAESGYIIHKCGIRRVITEERSLPIYLGNRESLGISEIYLSYGLSLTAPKEESALFKKNSGYLFSLPKLMETQSESLSLRRMIRTEDAAVILFTSGTTQHPKGAIYTNCNVLYGGLVHVAQMGMDHGDKFLSSMPCYHMDFQEMALMPVICTGSTLTMVEHYSARRFWNQVVTTKANFTDTMSMMNRTMLLQPVQPWEKNHSLKQIYFSMGLSDGEKEAFEARFNVSLLNSYGMTETVSGVTCAPLTGDKNWPSVGRAALSYEIKITDESGNEVPPGTLGEICVHGIPGRSIVSGYYNDPVATAALIDKDNWLHSGDRGYLDEEGWLFFVDRAGDLIKRAGENISSLEVECVLTSHPEIEDAAVIGIPDPIRDQAVKAFVRISSGASVTKEDLTAFCLARLSKFKIPTEWEFVTDFPRTPTGKIRKNDLKHPNCDSI